MSLMLTVIWGIAKSGANVVINYSSDANAADELLKAIGNDHALALKGDAGAIADIDWMVSETVKRFGKIDILIPCAGMLLMKDLEHTSEQDFDAIMRLNVKGPYFLAQVRSLSTNVRYRINKLLESSTAHG